jgi:hypothetical protein
MAVKELSLWVLARVGEALLDHPLSSVPLQADGIFSPLPRGTPLLFEGNNPCLVRLYELS